MTNNIKCPYWGGIHDKVCAQGLLLGSLSCIPPTTFLQSPTRALSTTLPGPACVCTGHVAVRREAYRPAIATVLLT